MTARKIATTDAAPPPDRARTPSIGLALGGGGARGLAHIAMLEAFDELGIKPAIISGTSIGAIYGAAYASGITGKALRDHTRDLLSQRFSLVRDVFAARALPFQRMLNPFASRTAILDPNALLDLIMPKGVKSTFESLEVPLKIVASDFYEQESVIYTSGALRPAVAASMALPVIFQPVISNGRAMIDGGLTNPLPFDLLTADCDVVVAIDVSGAPVPDPARNHPTAFEALFQSAFLFERSIDIDTYDRHADRVREQMTLLKIDEHTSKLEELDVEGILAFAERVLPRTADLWVQASLDQRQRLQQLFFPQGVAFDGSGFVGTAVTAPAFSYLQPAEEGKKGWWTRPGSNR